MGCVYKITNLINGKNYIGKTNRETPNRRFSEHRSISLDDSRPLYKAIRKYGINNFSFELLEDSIEASSLSAKEVYYIDEYNSFGREGYNLTAGGDNPCWKLVEDAEVQELVNLYKSGLTVQEIAIRKDCSSVLISRRLKSHNIKIKSKLDYALQREISIYDENNQEIYSGTMNGAISFIETLKPKGYRSTTDRTKIRKGIMKCLRGDREKYLSLYYK